MADAQKIRQTLIEDTILSLRGLLTKEYSIAVTGTFNGETSDLSKEVTQQSVLNAISLLTHELQNKNLSYLKDGGTVFVTEDSSDPINNIPLPVKLTSVTGDINITAGDLNVHSSHIASVGGDFDSMRIGDGTNLLKINADGSINVIITSAPSTPKTPSKITVTTDGTVASGARSVSMKTSSDFTGSILGDVATEDTVYSLADNDTLGEIPYIITTGSIEILEVR